MTTKKEPKSIDVIKDEALAEVISVHKIAEVSEGTRASRRLRLSKIKLINSGVGIYNLSQQSDDIV